MIDLYKVKYKVTVVGNDSRKYNITDYIQNIGWEENDKEISMRSSFTARNDKTSKGYLSSIIKPGCLVCIYAKVNDSSYEEVARGNVGTWNGINQSSSHDLKCTSYDELYNLQKSQDNFFFSSGTGTKARINKVLKAWKITLSSYDGPNKKHGKKAYKNKYLSDIILDILDDAFKKGGKRCIIRAEKGKIKVLPRGSNKDVYVFKANNTKVVNHTISIVNMVTRVKIIGKTKKKGKEKVIATVNGQTKYGIRQRIYTRGSDESLSAAKSAAKDIIKEDGKVEKEITVQSPDVPFIRKGDLVYMQVGSLKGYYYVMGVRHDADTSSMSMDIKKKG